MIQWRDGSKDIWRDLTEYHLIDGSSMTNLRIKPTPKLRPWKPEEVPVGALIKDKDRDDCFRTIISGVSLDGEVSHATGVRRTPEQELNEFIHSLDHGKTWLPCGVMEE